MQASRICRRPFADLSGEGARLYGGRRDSPVRAMVHAAGSVGLAVLEVRVHLDLTWDLVPDDDVLVTIDTGSAPIEDLPTLPSDTVAYGDAWLSGRRSPVLRVPSVIAPDSVSVLIDPTHPGSTTISITAIRPFSADRRPWPLT